MKKLLAILLTLVLTFSCFSILSVGTVSAETQNVGQVILESDFGNSDGTNWQSTNKNVTYSDDNGDGVNDYASVKISSTSKGAGLVSSPFNLIPGNEYELTYYIRVPEESVSFIVGSTFYAPTTVFYQPTVNSTGTKVSSTPAASTVEAENNYYAYSYTNKDDATKSWARRKGFATTWTIDGYEPTVKSNFSNFDYRDYGSVLSATNEDLNAAFANWTKVTVNFTAMAAVEGETSQVTALGFIFDSLKSSDNYVFDLKDVKLVCTDNGLTEKTILTSDFEKDITNTSWYVSGKVESKTEEAGDFARLTVADNNAAYVRSKSFELTPEQKYTLTYYMRIPEGSADYSTSWTQPFSPECIIYQTNGVSAGQAVKDNLADANLYANKDQSRRVNMNFYWNIDGYNTHTRTGYSDTGYHKSSALYGCVGGSNVSLNNAFKDWKKVTLEFTAEAETEGSTEASVVVLQFRVQQAANDLMYDIKDVTLTETAPKIKPEPDHSNAIFYEGFEAITQTELEALITNRSSWATVGFDTNDAATGVKAASVYAIWNDLFIPIDKEGLDTSTYYEFSMDWKLKVPTETKQSALTKLAIVGYNPSQGETIKDNAKALFSKEILYGIGDWKNTTLRFKISDLNSYEQFGILINYSGSEPYDSTDTLYIDTLMIDVAEDQSDVTIIDLDEQERTDDTIKVLAFGNSFSDDATVYIDDIAKADGKDLRVANCAKGGCSLNQHYSYMLNSEAAYSFVYYTKDVERQIFYDVTMQQALAATDWDYIVVQQVSQDSGMPDTFEPYLEDLLAYFKMQCPDAEILFHTTWAYAANSDHSGFANYGNDQSTMHEAIEDAYLEASARYGYVPLIPTGEAIRIARATSMGDNFNRDGYHLNDKGRMIAALVWYETFTGISALDTEVDLTTLTGTVGETGGVTGFVTADESAIIKAAAHEAAARFKLANETQLAIEAIGEVTADSGEAIENAKALRAELNDDGLLPNLQTLINAIETFESLGTETILPGDFTGSGNVDLEDVNILAQHLAGWNVEIASISLDLDGDNDENLKDLVLLAQYVAGWDVSID